ncbi:MAG: NAD(P)/FAD-dependent oxidoreductase [Tissierellia bacterium]|nr:NAD(P)/FAD-dependent oxidoreductase [Tissierellia bacterium]
MKTIIIGGGPAGIFAALNAKNKSNEVILLERNPKLGRKLAITGKGRCNITNDADISDFFNQINSNREFLYSAFYRFTNNDLIDYFQNRGLKLKVERGGRVFPESDKSYDILDILYDDLKRNGIKVYLNCKVKSASKIGEKFIVNTDEICFESDNLIIATGGKSYPKTGSDGLGYRLAESFGHGITNIKASLVPIEIKEDWIKELQGVSLKNVRLTISSSKEIASEFGEMVFTSYGISGPIVLRLSSYILENNPCILSLDLKPALDYDKLDSRILRDFKKYNNKSIKNALSDLTIKALIPVLLKYADIDPEKPVHQISKLERQNLINSFKNLKMNFKKLRPIDEAIITQGGVDVLKINPANMESKIVKNLYFAGEILDVDANTGGYNLQIAFSTGFLAGIYAGGGE